MSIVKLGPDAAYARPGDKVYVAIDDAALRMQIGSDMLISPECHTYAELERAIGQIRGDCDAILEEAKKRFPN